MAYGRTEVFALMLDMNALWERYVLALLRRIAPQGVTVYGQDSRPFWKAAGHRVRSIRPDIVVRQGEQARLIVDTKWKRPSNNRPASGDLQQMFAYNETFECQNSVLLYPGDPKLAVEGAFTGRSHACCTAFLNLVVDGIYSRAAAESQLGMLFES